MLEQSQGTEKVAKKFESEKELEKSSDPISPFYPVLLFFREKSLRPKTLNDFPKVSQLVIPWLEPRPLDSQPLQYRGFFIPKPKSAFLCMFLKDPKR